MYCRMLREIVSRVIYQEFEHGSLHLSDDEESVPIGGDGVEVQLDESAFGKRKYGRGHPVATKWVLGGIEIIPDKYGRKKGGRRFYCIVPDRTRETMIPTIQRFVKSGTTIITDGHATYRCLSECGFKHYWVNHKKHYVCPFTGHHTNTIEGTWNGVKRKLPKSAYRDPITLGTYLGEQMWRFKYRKNLWKPFLDALRHDTACRGSDLVEHHEPFNIIKAEKNAYKKRKVTVATI